MEGPGSAQRPKLLDQVRGALRLGHYSRRTEESYVGRIRRFILFHGKRHPATMSAPEIVAFLTHLATGERVSASTQNQALGAILFLYRHVLRQEVGELDGTVRARTPERLPVVLTRDEVRAVLSRLGVRALVRLAAEDETGLCGSDVERHAIRDCYEPVQDWTAPSQGSGVQIGGRYPLIDIMVALMAVSGLVAAVRSAAQWILWRARRTQFLQTAEVPAKYVDACFESEAHQRCGALLSAGEHLDRHWNRTHVLTIGPSVH